jgi:alkyl hydroperoxide reductase subunit D
MIATEEVRSTLPDAARDIRLNLQSVLESGSLNDAQKWGVAAACAIAARNPRLKDAILADALVKAGETVVEDARAAAVLMAMNNVYYRFRHQVGKPGYSQKPARLRMQRIAQPLTNKLDFELFCLAVSAINGCEACVKAHEQAVVEGGLSEEHVHDAVRIAGVVHAAAVALEA